MYILLPVVYAVISNIATSADNLPVIDAATYLYY